MTDLRQSKFYSKYLEGIGWIVEKKEGNYYFIKKIPVLGSFIKVQRVKILDFSYINKLAKKHRAYQIVLEPDLSLTVSTETLHKSIIQNGFRQARSTYLPSKTIHVDLRNSEKKLLSQMHYKTRYNIGVAKRKKVIVEVSDDISKFSEFWNRCTRKNRKIYLPLDKEIKQIYKAFGKNATVLFGKKDNEILSAILLLIWDNCTNYMYAASSRNGNKLFAPTLTAWKSITYAKKRQCKLYDFEGIYDARFPIKSWKGFSRFKKSFGGKEVEYPGAFVKYRLPL